MLKKVEMNKRNLGKCNALSLLVFVLLFSLVLVGLGHISYAAAVDSEESQEMESDTESQDAETVDEGAYIEEMEEAMPPYAMPIMAGVLALIIAAILLNDYRVKRKNQKKP